MRQDVAAGRQNSLAGVRYQTASNQVEELPVAMTRTGDPGELRRTPDIIGYTPCTYGFGQVLHDHGFRDAAGSGEH